MRYKHGLIKDRFQALMSSRHERGCAIPDGDIQETSAAGRFLVNSQSDPEWQHTVLKSHDQCQYCLRCRKKCLGCSRHAIKCDCEDNLSGYLCKHCHKVLDFIASGLDPLPQCRSPSPEPDPLHQPTGSQVRNLQTKEEEVRLWQRLFQPQRNFPVFVSIN